ncbi:MAG TPA: mechanosensitive ion channel family protein [Ohtaekwangia sp.]|nr:mechanosensitive ion channel family protein [Ohtaekwangia sp.]
MEILERVYFHNTVLDYLIALGIILIGLAFVRILRNNIMGRLKKWSEKTTTTGDDFVLSSIERFGIPALYYFTVYAGLNYLTLTEKTENVLAIATSLVVTFFIIRLLSSTIMMMLRSHIRKQENGQEKLNQLGGLMILINIVVWILGLVFLIDNLGYDVTTIIAGLGIGGIAIALAAQNILGDLFNYFVIFFDRPFEVGDFIIVDDKLGSIEYIGLKTTRVRSLSGEELIIGNANLTSSRIHNYKRMNKRRVVFSIDVAYGTPLERLKEISAMLRRIVESQQKITFDRAHFAAYKDWSLRFEVVYYVMASDFNIYMDIQQEINYQIYEQFEKLNIEFAFPSQTIFIKPPEGGIELKGVSSLSVENKISPENRKS